MCPDLQISRDGATNPSGLGLLKRELMLINVLSIQPVNDDEKLFLAHRGGGIPQLWPEGMQVEYKRPATMIRRARVHNIVSVRAN